MEENSTSVCQFLQDPLSLSELIGDGAKFQIKSNFDEDFASEIYEEFNGGSDEEDEDEIDRATLISPWQESFQELRLHMRQINEHIFKRIVREGADIEKGTVPENARVSIRYNAYWEGESAPFDSSFLRGSTFSFYTGCNSVLEGLEAAVRTMYTGEEAQFLISYHLLFHEMGCPPRVKPKADGLFIIELVKFNAVGDINATDNLSEEERNKYSIVIDKVKEIHVKGLDFFGQGLYRNAAKAFQKAVDALSYCRLANETEEREQKEFLIKLYTNLAVCYMKTDNPSKVCIMCREIRRWTNDKPSCKAIFLEGKALRMLGEYNRARSLILCALQMEPHNTEINLELKQLDETSRKYKQHEREIWTKAVGVIRDNTNSSPSGPNKDHVQKFEKEMQNLFMSLKSKDDFKPFILPQGLTEQEISIVDRLAESMEMKLSLTGNNEYFLKKKTTKK